MKKIYFVLVSLLLLTSYAAFAQPANDDCANAVSLTPGPTCVPTAGTNVLATQSVAPSTCSGFTSSSALDVWYSFVATATAHTITMAGGVGFDGIVELRSGACNGTSITCSDATVSGGTEVINAAGLTIGNTYLIRVYGWAGGTGTFTICVTTAAVIANDLCTGAITINCGQTINGTTLGATSDPVPTCVTALNTAPGVWYTFVGDGQLSTLSLCGSAYDTKIGVFTGTCGSLTCVTGNDDFCGLQSQVAFLTTIGTTYYVLVTGFNANSGAFTLNRTCTPAIPNDLCTGAITINCGQTINGNTSGAGIDAVPTCVTTLNTAPGVWYTFVGNGAPNTLSMCTGTSYDSKIGVFSGTCGSLVCVTGNDDFCGLQSQVTFNAVLGTTYYVLVTGFGSASGAFSLTRTSVLPNDLCTGAIDINCGQSITGSTACGATVDAVPTCVTTLNTAPGVWYKFVGDASPVTLSLCGSLYDTKIGVFTGTCTSLTCVTGNDDFCGVQSQVTFNTNAGVTYYVLVTGFSTNTGTYTLTRTCAPACAGVPSPGTVTPATSTVCRNTNVLLTASGFSPNSGLTFQWNQAPAAAGPFTPIAGAVSNTYTAAPAVTTYYTVTVTCSNGGGAATTSPPVVINVDGIAHVNVSATPSTLCAGGSTNITGTAINGITLSTIAVVANSGTINQSIPDNTPSGTSSTITVPAGINIPNPASMRVRINATHTWVGDLVFRLTSPCGTTFLFDRPGVPATTFGNSDDLISGGYTFDIAAATVIPETSVAGTIPTGSYKPSDAAGTANNTWSPLVFPCTATGNWTLTAIDNAGGDTGTLIDWQLLAPTPSNYTHTLTGGAGTITQNPPTGVANATGNFTVTGIPAGNHTFTLTSTDPFGCSVSSPVNITVNPIPTVVFSPASATICNGQIQQINVYASPGGILQTYNNNTVINVPGTGTVGNGSPYPSVINVAGLPSAGVTVSSVKIGNYNHTFPDDVDLVLVSPAGKTVILMSDCGGGTPATGQIFTFVDGAPALADNTFNNTGTYSPTNYGTPDNFPSPGPGSISGTTTLSSFVPTDNSNGDWKLFAVDDAGGDAGLIGNWSITFNVPAPVVLTQSPTTPNTIFTNAAATIPYVAGTPVYTVWVNPTTTTTYTGNATALGCAAPPAQMTVTVNQLPAITTQPSPATQTVCPGFTVTYTVAATGAGLTYQWQYNPGSGFVNLVNAGFISGVNTPTLTIANVQVANAGSYRVIVSGTCTPSVTSNSAVLNVGSAPTITTQPVNVTACETGNATFSVVAAGTPTPNIFQWQVSTDGGTTWTNLTTGGSYTPTLTLTNVTLAMNGNRYRVIVTNSCGMVIISNAVILTVNSKPVVTATALPTRICLSDTLVPLVGSPTGGSWSGIGVSGFNFVPPATAVGTYTLTYTYTSGAGCTNTATAVAKVEECPERIRLLSHDAVILYPNPNNGKFNIRINSTLYNYLGMKVYDMSGRLVNGKVVKNGTDQALVSPVFTGLTYGRVVPIDISYLPSGTYLVKFYYDDGVRSSEKGFIVVVMK